MRPVRPAMSNRTDFIYDICFISAAVADINYKSVQSTVCYKRVQSANDLLLLVRSDLMFDLCTYDSDEFASMSSFYINVFYDILDSLICLCISLYVCLLTCIDYVCSAKFMYDQYMIINLWRISCIKYEQHSQYRLITVPVLWLIHHSNYMLSA